MSGTLGIGLDMLSNVTLMMRQFSQVARLSQEINGLNGTQMEMVKKKAVDATDQVIEHHIDGMRQIVGIKQQVLKSLGQNVDVMV